ncbi:type VI secretion system baseplate subunit TssF [Candidatus Paracaedibacter symbiosus]|uniref:type VI secretion system baseplate subunit TssF n=1 Tax=Candidatus Paracaedibacter symbiosus TaxID=244582 RepID=UPI00050957F1|nr:type VI secretion system baseplate subunit TssF [Candidatus Paracaedibacter symbiosus]
MKTPVSEKFLTYYHRELSYLRNAGQLFAAQHPKIARRLQLSHNESPDPHVERLLESFAFLTAQLSQEIDDRLPQIAAALLGVLYPHLINPIPSMSVAQFVVDPTKGKLTSGFDIARHTPVFSYAEEGVACRFRTSYAVTLWPIEVVNVDFVHADEYAIRHGTKAKKWYLRLKLKSQGLNFSDLDLKSLRFHISCDSALAFTIYECLFAQTQHQILQSVDGHIASILPNQSLAQVGFNVNESILPSPDHSHPSYQLLHEYFHFPEKFLFFDINNLDLKAGGETADLLIGIDNHDIIGKMDLKPSYFKLGCTPIVNLFNKITDPLRLDHRHFEYRLVPDQRRERTTEIYSIQRVASTIDENPTTVVFTPYFSFSHNEQFKNASTYWLSRRVSSEKREVPGTDVVLSFVDLDFNPKLPPQNTIFAHTLCTNRFLAEQIPSGGVLQLEDRAPVSQIVCLNKPTSQIYSPEDGETLWRLISQLSVNHLSLTAGSASVNALKETLRLYSRTTQNYDHAEIDSIQDIVTRHTTRRMGEEAWRGFVNGLHITMTVNERSYTGVSVFLLVSVLRHFFTLQVSMNSFIELQLNSIQRNGEWMKWQPLRGDQIIL